MYIRSKYRTEGDDATWDQKDCGRASEWARRGGPPHGRHLGGGPFFFFFFLVLSTALSAVQGHTPSSPYLVRTLSGRPFPGPQAQNCAGDFSGWSQALSSESSASQSLSRVRADEGRAAKVAATETPATLSGWWHGLGDRGPEWESHIDDEGRSGGTDKECCCPAPDWTARPPARCCPRSSRSNSTVSRFPLPANSPSVPPTTTVRPLFAA